MQFVFASTFLLLVALLFYLNFRFLTSILQVNETIFNLGLTLVLTLGILQTTSLWFLIITSEPLNRVNTILILLTLTFISFLINLKFVKFNRWYSLLTFDYLLIAISIATVGIASISTINLGDSGWDSNAYHVPLIGMLTQWGSNNWPSTISQGTFTIYTPYGAHSVQALFVSIFSDFRSASIPTGILFIGGTLLCTTLVRKKISKILIISCISLTPSIFGQLTRNYVDIWAGIYLFSAVLVLVKLISLKRNHKSDTAFYIISVFILGLSASTKTQTAIASFLSLLVVIIVRKSYKKSLEFHLIGTLLVMFFASSSVPYLRNFIFDQNPIFPITNHFFSNGNISIKELSNAVESFRPRFWPHESAFDPILSILSPIWVLIVLVFNEIGIYLDSTRIDISAFTYDTTTGGAGLLTSISILSAAIILLFKLFKCPRIVTRMNLNVDVVLLIFAIVFMIAIPGAWYPRYGMAFYLLLSLASIRFLEKLNRSELTISLILLAGIPGVFGLSVFQNYDHYSNNRNPYFNPKYGLDSPPEGFSEICKKVAILEPRPTFTSFIWEAKCEQVISIPSGTKSLPSDFLIVANHKIESNIIGNRKSCVLRTWFDPNATYGTYLYSSNGFEGNICNPPQIQRITQLRK